MAVGRLSNLEVGTVVRVRVGVVEGTVNRMLVEVDGFDVVLVVETMLQLGVGHVVRYGVLFAVKGLLVSGLMVGLGSFRGVAFALMGRVVDGMIAWGWDCRMLLPVLRPVDLDGLVVVIFSLMGRSSRLARRRIVMFLSVVRVAIVDLFGHIVMVVQSFILFMSGEVIPDLMVRLAASRRMAYLCELVWGHLLRHGCPQNVLAVLLGLSGSAFWGSLHGHGFRHSVLAGMVEISRRALWGSLYGHRFPQSVLAGLVVRVLVWSNLYGHGFPQSVLAMFVVLSSSVLWGLV